MKTYRFVGFSSIATAAAIILLAVEPVRATPITSAGSGFWTNTATWVGGVVPDTDDHVAIAVGHNVTLNGSTAVLASLTNNGTLTFVGWETALNAAAVLIAGTVTHNVNTNTSGTLGVYDSWTPNNRIQIVCETLSVASTGAINTNGKGYQGSTVVYSRGHGPGGGPWTVSSGAQGAGYGGAGGRGRDGKGGVAYGSPYEPTDPGSGGGRGGHNAGGGNGGGAIRIVAGGAVNIDGTISANGNISGNDHSGGGSGGSIWITCDTMGGVGVLSANGGNLTGNSNTGSAGGGGRIALYYNPTAQALLPQPALRFTTTPGYGNPNGTQYVDALSSRKGGIGTLYLPDNLLLPDTLSDAIRDTRLYGVQSWAPNTIIVSNTVILFAETALLVSSPESVTVIGQDLVPLGSETVTSQKIPDQALVGILSKPCRPRS